MQRKNEKVLVVDFNPNRIDELERKTIPSLYGDAIDEELFEEVPLWEIKYIICTLNDFETNLNILKDRKNLAPSAKKIMVANTIEETKTLYEWWADYVIMPDFLWSNQAINLLKKFEEKEDIFEEAKIKHLKKLKKYIM